MDFVPLNDFVIVKKIAGDTVSAGGIVLTTAQNSGRAKIVQPPNYGEDDRFLSEKFRLKIGDSVVLKWSNTLPLEDDHYAIDRKDIVCKVTD